MKKIKSYLIILLGVIITSIAISMFFVPNKIVSGGISGLSTILYYTLSIPTGLSYFIINFILLLVGYKFVGKDFFVKTLICSGLVSLFVDIFSKLPPVTDDVVLASLFGGVIYGIGIGLTLIEGASTGGTDIVSRLIQYKFRHIQIGKSLLFVDMVIIVISLICFKRIALTLYGILGLYISTTSIDALIKNMNISKLAFVISDSGEEIAKELVSTSPRGITILNATGAYTMSEKTMLVCAMKKHEIPAFQEKILKIDNQAFIVFSESQEIVGNGFYVYH